MYIYIYIYIYPAKDIYAIMNYDEFYTDHNHIITI